METSILILALALAVTLGYVVFRFTNKNSFNKKLPSEQVAEQLAKEKKRQADEMGKREDIKGEEVDILKDLWDMEAKTRKWLSQIKGERDIMKAQRESNDFEPEQLENFMITFEDNIQRLREAFFEEVPEAAALYLKATVNPQQAKIQFLKNRILEYELEIDNNEYRASGLVSSTTSIDGTFQPQAITEVDKDRALKLYKRNEGFRELIEKTLDEIAALEVENAVETVTV